MNDTTLTEAEREALIEAVQAGDEVACVESFLAARLAKAEGALARVQALPDAMAEAWGGDASWFTTGAKVADLVRDWLDAALVSPAEPGEGDHA